jgi:formate hydrogenlyase subunit 6/NADH:ubiquinone oxidoreductase subunit I
MGFLVAPDALQQADDRNGRQDRRVRIRHAANLEPRAGQAAREDRPVNPNKPSMHDDYTLATVDPNWLQERVKPRRHIALSPELCILCRACEDVCPWDCIYMLSPNIVAESEGENLSKATQQAEAIFVIDDNECVRCGICIDRCPTGALWYARVGEAKAAAKG